MLKSSLSNEIKLLNCSYHLVKPAERNDIIISGITTEIEDSPQRIVNRVFSTLQTSDLSEEINEIRVNNTKYDY